MTPRSAVSAKEWEVGAPLLEREPELAEISESVDATTLGEGGVLLLEGPEGIGKTALLEGACAQARRVGMTTLSARAGELESGLPWGVVRDLFEVELATASPAEQRELLSGAAGLARIALRTGAGDAARREGDLFGPALHGLYWLTANMAARRPVLLAIDDVHWADRPSLRWLAYLVARLEGLAVLVVATVRPRAPGMPLGPISAIAQAARVLRPSALSPESTAGLVRATLGEEASPQLCRSCHSATAGNPFLLRCVLEELRDHRALPDGAPAEKVTEIHSDAISQATVARLARLPPVARDLASAIAILGARCSLADAAAIAGLDEDDAVEGADALAAQGLIAQSEPLEFVHPIVRTAVYDETPTHRRLRWHRRAAALLDDAQAPADEIAVHLLHVEPAGDAAVVDILRSAAASALDAGAPEPAVEYLDRALGEPPAAGARAALLRQLGAAEASLQRPAGAEHLRAAHGLSSQPSERGEIALELAATLMHSGRLSDAVDLLERAIGELPPENRELGLELEADLIGAGRLTPALRQRALKRVGVVRAAGLKGRTFGERVALSAVALEPDAPVGTAAESVEYALRALAGGQLLEEAGVESPSFWYAASALILAGAFELADPVLESALAKARSRGSTAGAALGFGFRALLAYRTGRLADAEADARHAIDIAPGPRWAGSVYALVFLIEILLDRGQPEEAARAVAETRLGATDSAPLPLLLVRHGRGRLRLALGDADAGLTDMRAAVAQLEAGAFPPHMWPWRSAHALALTTVGESEEACRLADEELSLTRAFGAPGPLGASLRARALVEPGGASLDLLREATEVLAGSEAALEHARVLVDFGAALRRAGRRSDGADSLREGLDLAHRCGASALAARAREELVAAGARPRRDALRGRDALTASELRVARMAADGHTNREIAQALFIGLRTVETHLTHAYRKLAIQSRDALPGAL